MRKYANLLLEYGLLIIITIPSFISLINPYFFSMHDSQQVARLYVLTEAMNQGSLYPRWVDLFGFNYGYPLFNFYPPLIYYAGAFFHMLGFSLLWSVKMVFILGYVLAAVGMYQLVKTLMGKNNLISKSSAFLSAVLYTYFAYHAVNNYVRGAMAEFFSMAVLPFVFLSLERLKKKISLKNGLFFSATFTLLILTHPLIAFPSLIFIGAYMLHSLVLVKEKPKYCLYAAVGFFGGLLLSAFYWIPSMLERKYTLVDSILLKELARYQIHFVCPSQLWYSPWGYGGSVEGCSDGMSFMLGKVHIALAVFSLLCIIVFLIAKKKPHEQTPTKTLLNEYGFYFVFMLFSIFMTLQYSEVIWKTVGFLQYLQFPWRFLTFTDLFLSVVGGLGVYFFSALTLSFRAKRIEVEKSSERSLAFARDDAISLFLVTLIVLATIFTYQKYFKPQTYQHVTDKELTSFDEIAWRVSRTSFEFVPKGVKAKKSDLNTTVLAIDRTDLNRSLFELKDGTGKVTVVKNDYANKAFDIDSLSGFIFRLHTYNFPGWSAYVDGAKVHIDDSNDLKLITIQVPAGSHHIRFIFEQTPVRKIGTWLSIGAFIAFALYFAVTSIHPGKRNI